MVGSDVPGAGTFGGREPGERSGEPRVTEEQDGTAGERAAFLRAGPDRVPLALERRGDAGHFGIGAASPVTRWRVSAARSAAPVSRCRNSPSAVRTAGWPPGTVTIPAPGASRLLVTETSVGWSTGGWAAPVP
ncbi:hypothetical protein ACFQVA_01930 [Actinomadura keratinilytica]